MAKSTKGRPKTIPTLKFPRAFEIKLWELLVNAGGKVEVAGHGTFELVKIPQKKTYHNFSKRTRIVKGYRKLKFTQSGKLKESLTEEPQF